MKKIVLLSSLIIGSVLAQSAYAQVHVNVNIGVQPVWGPVGYNYAEYYYLPDIEAYYCIPRREFVYFDGEDWLFSSSLPYRCRNYDLYSGYKVVINERNPWNHFNDHRAMYAPFRYRHDQTMIRDQRGYGSDNYGRPFYGGRARERDWHDEDQDRRRDRSYGDGRHGERGDREEDHERDHDRRRGRW